MSRQYLRPVRNIALAAIMAMAMSSVVFAAGGNEEDGATDARIAGMNGGRYYGGIHIIAVDEDSPAAEAGLLPDDTIIAVDGEAMQPWFLGELVEEIDAGQELRLNVLRAADETSDRFTPEELLIDLTVGSGEEGEAYIGISYPAIAGRPDFDSREAGKDVRGRMPRGGRAVPGGERGGFRPPNRTGDLEDVEGMGTRQL